MEKAKKPKSNKVKFAARFVPTLDGLLKKASAITGQAQNAIVEDALAMGLGVASPESKVRMQAVKRAVGNHGTHDASVEAIRKEEREDGR